MNEVRCLYYGLNGVGIRRKSVVSTLVWTSNHSSRKPSFNPLFFVWAYQQFQHSIAVVVTCFNSGYEHGSCYRNIFSATVIYFCSYNFYDNLLNLHKFQYKTWLYKIIQPILDLVFLTLQQQLSCMLTIVRPVKWSKVKDLKVNE